LPPRARTPKLNDRSIEQEKVMLHSTSKQWHTVSLCAAATMPIASRFGYVDERPENLVG